MTRATLTILALAALAACGPTMTTTGADGSLAGEGPVGGAEGADPPGTAGPGATPWWGLPG